MTLKPYIRPGQLGKAKPQQHLELQNHFSSSRMADGLGYGGFGGVPHPYWLRPHPPASTPQFLATHPVESSDQRFDPMIPHHRSPSSGDYTGPPVPVASFVTPLGIYIYILITQIWGGLTV